MSQKRWFHEHPQFKHLIHMVCSPTRKVMGLWMMLIRTIATPKSRQAWFVVNGVPIQQSIREQGLISGLYCYHYPENYMSGLSMKFAVKHFRKIFMKKTCAKPRPHLFKNVEVEVQIDWDNMIYIERALYKTLGGTKVFDRETVINKMWA